MWIPNLYKLWNLLNYYQLTFIEVYDTAFAHTQQLYKIWVCSVNLSYTEKSFQFVLPVTLLLTINLAKFMSHHLITGNKYTIIPKNWSWPMLFYRDHYHFYHMHFMCKLSRLFNASNGPYKVHSFALNFVTDLGEQS